VVITGVKGRMEWRWIGMEKEEEEEEDGGFRRWWLVGSSCDLTS
jgi:hypothetical protein